MNWDPSKICSSGSTRRWSDGHRRWARDVDGDGRKDIICETADGLYVALVTVTGFAPF